MPAEERPPIFEVHIRPMFRLLDREHMSNTFDLWNLDEVWTMRNDILAHVGAIADMPGDRFGGPWPSEWVALFERWMATGAETDMGHHLVLAKPDGPYKVEAVSAEKRRLTATVTAPTDGCRAWFECDSVSPTQREHTLYLEPAFPPAPPEPTPLQAKDVFTKGDATKLVIHDADGTHEVPIT